MGSCEGQRTIFFYDKAGTPCYVACCLVADCIIVHERFHLCNRMGDIGRIDFYVENMHACAVRAHQRKVT